MSTIFLISIVIFGTVSYFTKPQSIEKRLILGNPKGPLRLEIEFPPAQGQVPAVVLAHGCAGVNALQLHSWKSRALELGYAVIIVDSFSGRNVDSICSELSEDKKLPIEIDERVQDLFTTLDEVSKISKINSNKIGLIGFSNGGTSSLLASQKRSLQRFGKNEKFYRSVISVYGGCYLPFKEEDEILSDLFIIMAERDDWANFKPCANVIGHRTDRHGLVEGLLLKDATHSFDSPKIPPEGVLYLGKYFLKYNVEATNQAIEETFRFLQKSLSNP